MQLQMAVYMALPSAVRVVYSDASETGYGGYVCGD